MELIRGRFNKRKLFKFLRSKLFIGFFIAVTFFILNAQLIPNGVGDESARFPLALFAGALLVFTVFMFATQVKGIFAGYVSVVSLLSYPLFFAQSRSNIEDLARTLLYTVVFYAFYKGVIKKKIFWIILSTVVLSLALETKINIVFVPIIALTWLFFARKKEAVLKSSRLFIFAGAIFLFLVPIFVLLTSLKNPAVGFFNTFTFDRDLAYGMQYKPNSDLIFGLNVNPLQLLFFTTPFITLFLAGAGLVYALKKGLLEKHSASLLFLFWFAVPILAGIISGASGYIGVHQVMEYLPAMALLAGIGASFIVQNLKFKIFNFKLPALSKLQRGEQLSTFIFELLIILSFMPITLKLISLYPNENLYFNPLIGGFAGAKEKNFSGWGTTLGSTYQQGIDWLNKHAEQKAQVTLARELDSDVFKAKFRQDLKIDSKYFSGSQKKGEYIMEIIDDNWNSHALQERKQYLETLEPIHRVTAEGVPILKIWKNDLKHNAGSIIVVAGDIACGPNSENSDAGCKEWETSELIRTINPDGILIPGDIQYEGGEIEYFLGKDPFCSSSPPRCFGPTWGRFKDKIFPVPGNHEYGGEEASGYFDYFNGPGKFGGRAGNRDKGYYSFNLGSWHIVALNSNCSSIGGCDINSPQVRWLKNDLRGSKSQCTLAFWHHPRFSEGMHGDDKEYSDFWKVLYGGWVEVVINGHSHDYERYPRMNPGRDLDPEKGIRQFVVGTGGRNLTGFREKQYTKTRTNTVYGVLKITLYEDRYDWDFVPIEGQVFKDSGIGYCH